MPVDVIARVYSNQRQQCDTYCCVHACTCFYFRYFIFMSSLPELDCKRYQSCVGVVYSLSI